MSYWHYRLVLGWYLHQPESRQLDLQKVSQFVSLLVREAWTHRSDQGYLGPIKMQENKPTLKLQKSALLNVQRADLH